MISSIKTLFIKRILTPKQTKATFLGRLQSLSALEILLIVFLTVKNGLLDLKLLFILNLRFFAIITFTNLDQGGGTTSVFAFYCGKLASVAKHEGAVGITISITLHILNMVLSSVSCTD